MSATLTQERAASTEAAERSASAHDAAASEHQGQIEAMQRAVAEHAATLEAERAVEMKRVSMIDLG